MIIGFIRMGGVMMLLALCLGCGAISPSLYPVMQEKSSSDSNLQNQLTAFVKPVITTGFSSEERRNYKMDLSAHFTAFEMTLLNQTSFPVSFNSGKVFLIDDKGKKYAPLSVDESLNYYRYGEAASKDAVVILSKPFATMKREMGIIESLHLRSRELSPGDKIKGVLFFKKLSPEHCQHIRLVNRGLTFHGITEKKEMTFHFSCAPEGFSEIKN